MSTAERKRMLLLQAAKNNELEPFRAAFNLRGDLDAAHDWEGMPRTPLMVACLHGSIKVIRFLLDTKKVYVEYRSTDGKTALDYAKEGHLPEDVIESMILEARRWMIYNFKITPCPKHVCVPSHSCPYLHSHNRERRHPGIFRYSPALCENIEVWHQCKNGLKCTSAHSNEEITYHPDKFRTKKCRYGENCAYTSCGYAHNGEEKLLRGRAAADPIQPPPPRHIPEQAAAAIPPPLPEDIPEQAGVPIQQPLPEEGPVEAGNPVQPPQPGNALVALPPFLPDLSAELQQWEDHSEQLYEKPWQFYD